MRTKKEQSIDHKTYVLRTTCPKKAALHTCGDICTPHTRLTTPLSMDGCQTVEYLLKTRAGHLLNRARRVTGGQWRQHTTVTPASGTSLLSLLHAKKAAYNWSAACKARAQRKRGPVGWRTAQKSGCPGQRGRRQHRGRLLFEPFTGDLQGGILFSVSPHCLLQGFRKVSLVSTFIPKALLPLLASGSTMPNWAKIWFRR